MRKVGYDDLRSEHVPHLHRSLKGNKEACLPLRRSGERLCSLKIALTRVLILREAVTSPNRMGGYLLITPERMKKISGLHVIFKIFYLAVSNSAIPKAGAKRELFRGPNRISTISAWLFLTELLSTELHLLF